MYKLNKKYLLLICIAAIISVCIFLQDCAGNKTERTGRFDFIDNFESAEKQGFDNPRKIKSFIPPPTDSDGFRSLMKKIIMQFSYDVITLSKNGEKISEPSKIYSDGGFRFKFFNDIDNEGRFFFVFNKKNSNNFFEVQLITGFNAAIIVAKYINGKRIVLKKQRFPLVHNRDEVISVVFISQYLIITNNTDIMLLSLEEPGIAEDGKIGFNYIPGSSVRHKYILKFTAIKQKEKAEILDDKERGIPELYKQLATLSGEHWNGLHGEYRLYGKEKNPYLRRLRLGKETMRGIYFTPGTSMIYNVEIPERSTLEFALASPSEEIKKGTAAIFHVDIAPDAKTNKKYKYNLSDYSSIDKEFKRLSIDLSEFGGKKCRIKFSLEVPGENRNNAEKKVLLALCSPVLHRQRNADEKNVIIILLDTLRADHLGCYGYTRDTSPNIDKFAAESTLFLHPIAAAPYTLPSHMSLLASLYPTETGYIHHMPLKQHMISRYAENVLTLADAMQAGGYKTAGITDGGLVSSLFGFDKGFDYYYESGRLHDHDIALHLEFTKRWLSENKEHKFFLFFHSYDTHGPYYHDYFVKELKNPNRLNRAIARYDSGIRYADKHIGSFLEWLKANELYEDTLIILTSDHGENFDYLNEKGYGSHGMTLYDCEIRVPLIIGGVEGMRTGRIINDQCRLIDIMPTILDYLDIDIETGVRGISLIDMLNDHSKSVERIAYSEAVVTKYFRTHDTRSLRTNDYKLIAKTYRDKKNADKNSYRLYNLCTDSSEQSNIADKRPDLLKSYNSILQRILQSIKKNRKHLRLRLMPESFHNTKLEDQLRALGYLGN